MCELFGFSADREYAISNLLQAFFEHSYCHKHGWGMAMYRAGNKNPFLAKEAVPAYRSAYLYKLLKQDTGIVTHLGIAHIRFASKGNVSLVNTHPFVARIKKTDWVLAHNGTLYGKICTNKNKNKGQTDSEKILCKISEAIENCTKKTEIEKLENTLAELTWRGHMNLLFTEGKSLFVYCNRRKTLYLHEKPGRSIIMTNPVTNHGWKPLETNRLFIYENGIRIYEGRRLDSDILIESEWEDYFRNRYENYAAIKETGVFQKCKKNA